MSDRVGRPDPAALLPPVPIRRPHVEALPEYHRENAARCISEAMVRCS